MRWVAALTVVLRLGAGHAAAQTFTVDEDFADRGVRIVAAATEGEEMRVEVTVRAKVDPPADPADDQAHLRTVTVVLRASQLHPTDEGYSAGNQAEASDYAFHEEESESRIEFPDDTDDRFVEVSATFTGYTIHDPDAEDEVFKVTARLTGAMTGTRDSKALIDDDETQRYDLALVTGRPTEGARIEATLRAVPAHEDGASRTSVKVRVDTPGYVLDDASYNGVRIGNDDIPTVKASHTVTLEAPDNDGNRQPDTVMLRAFLGTGDDLVEQDALAITVTDVHGLPAVAAAVVDANGRILDPQPGSVKEGQTVKVRLTSVDDDGNALAFREQLSVRLTPAGAAGSGDYGLSMNPVDIAADGESATVDLTVEEDQFIDAEPLVLDAVVAGERTYGAGTRTSSAVLSLAIEDTTPRLVRAKPEADIHAVLTAARDAAAGDHGLNPGEDFELTGGDLFDAAADVAVLYSAGSEDESVVRASTRGDTLRVMPTAEGTAHVTVTATVAPPASGVEIIEQTAPNVARVRFPVEVTLAPPTFSLSADKMNIVEGAAATLTVSASRPVSVDTLVMLERDGASSAGDDDYELSPTTVTIEAGEMSARAEVRAVEDGAAEESEVLTLFVVADGVPMPDASVSLYLWDVAVPVLPFVPFPAPLLLVLLLLIGAYRRQARRQLGG